MTTETLDETRHRLGIPSYVPKPYVGAGSNYTYDWDGHVYDVGMVAFEWRAAANRWRRDRYAVRAFRQRMEDGS